MRGGDLHTRTRLPAAERRAQIMRAAEALLLEQGYLPLSLEQLGRSIGSSKALIYTYFTDQESLFNAVLEMRLNELAERCSASGRRRKSLLEEARIEADAYYQQVIEIGPIISYILRDPFMRRKISVASRRSRERLVRPLVRMLRKGLKLSPNEAVATFSMLATIPEEAGVIVRRGDLDVASGREHLQDILSACLAGLRAGR